MLGLFRWGEGGCSWHTMHECIRIHCTFFGQGMNCIIENFCLQLLRLLASGVLSLVEMGNHVFLWMKVIPSTPIVIILGWSILALSAYVLLR